MKPVDPHLAAEGSDAGNSAAAGDAAVPAFQRPESFETALDELESLVGRMEGGRLSLDSTLELFRRGVGLVGFCRTELERYEQQVTVLEGELERPLGDLRAATAGPAR